MIIKITPITSEEDKDSPYYGMEARDIYLRKGDDIIGLHSIGEPNSEWIQIEIDGTRTEKKGYRAWEQWGNQYDENHKMLGRGSFRVFEPIEDLAKEFEKDGWVSYEGPKKKET